MKPAFLLLSLTLGGPVLNLPIAADAAGFAVQQNSSRNYVYVIQARNPFHTRSRNRTVTTGNTTVTEIVEIGPDPGPVSVRQTGLANWTSAYQRGTAPNLDIRQDGVRNDARSEQYAMP